jgi:hypothetical protein
MVDDRGYHRVGIEDRSDHKSTAHCLPPFGPDFTDSPIDNAIKSFGINIAMTRPYLLNDLKKMLLCQFTAKSKIAQHSKVRHFLQRIKRKNFKVSNTDPIRANPPRSAPAL